MRDCVSPSDPECPTSLEQREACRSQLSLEVAEGIERSREESCGHDGFRVDIRVDAGGAMANSPTPKSRRVCQMAG
jgi:hypothetical protein